MASEPKRKRKEEKKKRGFKRSLRQATHPIPPGKREEPETRYDRSRAKREAGDEIDKDMDHEDGGEKGEG